MAVRLGGLHGFAGSHSICFFVSLCARDPLPAGEVEKLRKLSEAYLLGPRRLGNLHGVSGFQESERRT